MLHLPHPLRAMRQVFKHLQEEVVKKWPTDDTVRTRAVRYMSAVKCGVMVEVCNVGAVGDSYMAT